MGTSENHSGLTRRAMLNGSLRVGVGAAAFALLGQRAAVPAFAEGGPAVSVEALVDDLVDRAAEFERGQARGVSIRRASGKGVARGGPGAELISAPVALPFDASHVGLHWLLSEGGPESLSVSVRTRKAGREWSAWQPLEVETVADRGGAVEVFAALADGGRGRHAQYRVEFVSGPVALDQMVVTAINSVDGPRKPLATSAATTVTVEGVNGMTLQVVTREGWGCDPTLGLKADGTKLWPEMYVPAKKLILHHTATSNGYANGAAEVRAVYVYHAQTQGWGDIGYNVLVDKYGAIYEGRRGRDLASGAREVLSADVVAGHVLSHNYGSVGVSAIGNFDTTKPTAKMLGAIDDVFAFECARHYVVPTSASDFLKSNDLWHSGLNNISGHYESDSTKCPGRNLKSYLSTLKTHVSTRLSGQLPPTLKLTASSLKAPGSLSFAWSGGTSWQYCLEGWRRKPNGSEDLIYLSGYDQLGDSVPAARQVWLPISATSKGFSNLAAGHYTMHLRADGGTYEANLTYLVTS